MIFVLHAWLVRQADPPVSTPLTQPTPFSLRTHFRVYIPQHKIHQTGFSISSTMPSDFFWFTLNDAHDVTPNYRRNIIVPPILFFFSFHRSQLWTKCRFCSAENYFIALIKLVTSHKNSILIGPFLGPKRKKLVKL